MDFEDFMIEVEQELDALASEQGEDSVALRWSQLCIIYSRMEKIIDP